MLRKINYKGKKPLILAIPRGAVTMGQIIADKLGANWMWCWCAVPVAPPDTLAKVAELADEVVCLEAPEFFQAVGQFYRHFPQVDDDEVIEILKGS